jgi:hypothetical protein
MHNFTILRPLTSTVSKDRDAYLKYFVKPTEHSTHMSETRHHSPDPYAVDGLGAVEARVHRLAEALDGLIQRVATAPAPEPAPGPASFRFFYAEMQTLETLKYNEWHSDENNMDKILFRAGRFYFDGTDNYITKISSLECAGAELKVRIDVAGELEKIRIGYMRESTYKKLFCFVVAQSGSVDLFGDPIGDHIAYLNYIRIINLR